MTRDNEKEITPIGFIEGDVAVSNLAPKSVLLQVPTAVSQAAFPTRLSAA